MANSSSESDEEIYEVEKIVGHTIIKAKKKSSFQYLIKWLNYSEDENTWEKENNIFTTDLIAQYWEQKPVHNADRKLFEELQSKKKNPIVLKKPVRKEAKVITVSRSPSPPSSSPSPSPSPVLSFTNKQPLISSLFNSKTTDTDAYNSEINKAESSSIQAKNSTAYKQSTLGGHFKLFPATLTTPAMPVAELEKGKGKDKETVDFYPPPKPKEPYVEVADVEETVTTPSPPSKATTSTVLFKRKRADNTDYFLEEHKKKKRLEQRQQVLDNEDDDISSITSSTVNISGDDDDEKGSEVVVRKENIIFDKDFGVNPPLDWDDLVESVTEIRQEFEGCPIYCSVKWKDGVVSMHALELIRQKRPDLLIDALLKITRLDKNE